MKVKIFTTKWCSYCKASKRFLKEKYIKFEEIDIEKEEISREDLKKITGGQTVPQIIIDDSPIGGYEDLIALDAEEKLSG